MNFVSPLLLILTCILFVPILVLLVQVLFAYIPKYRPAGMDNPACSLAVIIPAHNESAGIKNTIDSVFPHLKESDRLIVIADNCSDDTAKVAKEAGAEVIERFDDVKRGKGFALDFGVRFLENNPPDTVVIIDADCIVTQGQLRVLASHAHLSGRPVQALYLMLTTAQAGIKSKIAQFAWLVKNQVRPLGFDRIGLPCPLMGSGMAFPWTLIANAALSSDNIVEDLKLGIDLSKAGFSPVFFPQVVVTSYFPENAEAQATQRKRWEHGHLTMILVEAPKLLLLGIGRLNLKLITMALDLIVPPIALLVVLMLGLTIIAVMAYGLGFASSTVLWLIALQLFVFGLTIMLAWWGWARAVLPFSGFLMAPIYVLGKLPNYLLYLVKRQKKWIRTGRD